MLFRSAKVILQNCLQRRKYVGKALTAIAAAAYRGSKWQQRHRLERVGVPQPNGEEQAALKQQVAPKPRPISTKNRDAFADALKAAKEEQAVHVVNGVGYEAPETKAEKDAEEVRLRERVKQEKERQQDREKLFKQQKEEEQEKEEERNKHNRSRGCSGFIARGAAG